MPYRRPAPDYQTWLEAPYQAECRKAEQYEAALDEEQEIARKELDQLTVADLLKSYDTFPAHGWNILGQALPPSPPQPILHQTLQWSLEECFAALALSIAEQRLAQGYNPADDYDPDPGANDNFDPFGY